MRHPPRQSCGIHLPRRLPTRSPDSAGARAGCVLTVYSFAQWRGRPARWPCQQETTETAWDALYARALSVHGEFWSVCAFPDEKGVTDSRRTNLHTAPGHIEVLPADIRTLTRIIAKDLFDHPVAVPFLQHATMIGPVTLTGDRLTFDFTIGRSGDDRCTTADAVGHPGNGPAVNLCFRGARDNRTRAVLRAGVTVAYENNRFHKQILYGLGEKCSEVAAGEFEPRFKARRGASASSNATSSKIPLQAHSTAKRRSGWRGMNGSRRVDQKRFVGSTECTDRISARQAISSQTQDLISSRQSSEIPVRHGHSGSRITQHANRTAHNAWRQIHCCGGYCCLLLKRALSTPRMSEHSPSTPTTSTIGLA